MGSRLEKISRFNLIDTPGLNATDSADEIHVGRTIKTLSSPNATDIADKIHVRKTIMVPSGTETIHLILVVVPSTGLLTDGLKNAVKAYSDIIPDFDGITAFVYTKFDYSDQASKAVELKMRALQETLKRDICDYPYFKIDCRDIPRTPIRTCITWNTIQNILELAAFNRSVDMRQHLVDVHKTEKMCEIDNILKKKFTESSETIENTLRLENKKDGDDLANVFRMENTVYELEGKLRAMNRFMVRRDESRSEVLYEKRHDMDRENYDEQVKFIHVPGQESDVTLLAHNVEMVKPRSTDESHKILYKQKSNHRAVIHVKFYTTKSHLSEYAIKKGEEQSRLWTELADAKKKLTGSALYKKDERLMTLQINKNHISGRKIFRFVVNDVLEREVFDTLVEADAYVGSIAECTEKVEAVYLRLPLIDMNS